MFLCDTHQKSLKHHVLWQGSRLEISDYNLFPAMYKNNENRNNRRQAAKSIKVH